MSNAVLRRLISLCALAAVTALPAEAADYWSYRNNNIEVVSTQGAAFTVSLARDLERFDGALSQVLQLKGTAHTPTYVYLLPADVSKALLGSTDTAKFSVSGYDVTVVSSSATPTSQLSWGAYFGYAGGLLVSDRAMRYPSWLRTGVPLVFSNPRFTPETVVLGMGGWDLGSPLRHGGWIPMRSFLTLSPSDPQFNEQHIRSTWEAQCWFVAREVFVEGKFRQEFLKYFSLMNEGTPEAQAFATSFGASSEQLDKALQSELRDGPVHEYRIQMPPSPPTGDGAVKLSEVAAKGRLALLMVRMNHAQQALALAADTLRQQADNGSALLAAAQADLQLRDYAGALASSERLHALAQVQEANVYAQGGSVELDLARAVKEGKTTLPVDTTTLLQRARQDFERALELQDDGVRAWSGLAWVYALTGDAAGARTLVPNADKVMAHYGQNAALARAVTEMCAATGQDECARQFAQTWRAAALSDADRERAEAQLSRLRDAPPGSATASSAPAHTP